MTTLIMTSNVVPVLDALLLPDVTGRSARDKIKSKSVGLCMGQILKHPGAQSGRMRYETIVEYNRLMNARAPDEISGSVERITYYNEQNGYSVLRLKPDTRGMLPFKYASGRDALITVVGNLWS